MIINFPKILQSKKPRPGIIHRVSRWLSGRSGPFCIVLALAFGLQTTSFAQAVQSGSGAPTQDFEVANGPRTFTVTVLGGAISSGTVNITLPTGYVIVGGAGSVAGTGVTATLGSVSGNTATINLSGIPTAGNNATFTYKAYATCAAIGVDGNQASYVFTASGGSSLPAVTSNAFNLRNAKINITNLANSPVAAGAVGDAYTRTFRIVNNGFGSIDTVYVTDVSGIGVEHVSHSVSNASDGSTVSVDLLSTTTSGSSTTYLYRFIVSTTAQDNHLGQNEYFTFTQNLKIASCDNLITSLNAWYGTGPDATPCTPQNDMQTTALAVDNSKQPVLTFINITSAFHTCRGVSEVQEFKVQNTGTSVAKDILLRLFHVNGTTTALPGNSTGQPAVNQVGYVSGSFKYKIGASGTYTTVPIGAGSGVTLTNQVYYTQASCLNTTAPDRLDLVVPELAVGEEIYFQYEEINCCVTACTSGIDVGSMVRNRFSNPCGQIIGNTLSSGNAFNLRNTAYEESNIGEDFPTDMVPGTSYTLKWETIGANYSSTIYPLGSTVRYEISLPPGLVYSGGTISMKTRDGSTATPSAVVQTGNILSITFKTGVNGFTINNYHSKAILSIEGITLDCSLRSTSDGNSVNTKLFYQSVSCSTCERQVFCGDQSIALHCPAPCEAGMVNNNFTVVRSNYGQPDNANSGTANGASLSNNVRTNWVSRGDLLDFTFYGTVADASATLHNFKYGYAKFTIPNSTAAHFTEVSAHVKITNAAGSVIKADLADYPLTYSGTASGGTASVDYSIDKLTAAGATGYTQFVNTDKVIITITLRVSNGIGGQLSATTVSTDFYLSDAANPTGSVTADKWSCDNFSGAYTLLGMMPYAYNGQTVSGNECSTITTTGSLGYVVGEHVNNGGPGINFYADEYRQLGVPGNYNITYPTGYTVESLTFSYIRGTSGYSSTNVSISNPTADAVSGQTYTYNIRKLFVDQGGTWLLPDEGFYVNFSAVLRPTCEAPTSSQISFNMEILPGAALSETLPAASFTPSITNTLALTKSNLVVNANSPVQTVTGNTVTWEVQVANTQPGTTPKIWMGENNTPSNGVTIQSVQQITGFGGTTTGSALTPTSGMYQLGAYGQESRYYRITATFTNCEEDILPLAIGYVCGDYPASLEAAQCKILTDLTVISTGANLQVSLIGQPVPTYPDGTRDLCDELQYTAEVKNPAQGTAYTLTLAVKKPAGIEYVTGSYELSHTILPAVASYTSISDANVTVTADSILFTIPTANIAELPYNDGYTIRYKMKTVACDFVSGTKMRLQAFGVEGCGAKINGTRQETQTIRIKGENPNPNAYTITSSIVGDIQACATPGSVTYTFSARNDGPVATYTGESLRIVIPKPYVMGSTTGVSNFSGFGAPTATSNATSNIYTWTVPVGIAAGQVISFTAPLTLESGPDATTLVCGNSTSIKELIAYAFEATCTGTSTVCSGNLQAEGENETSVINVVKPSYSVTAVTAAQSAEGELSGTVTVANSAPSAGGSAQSATLRIYHDTNNDGVVDGSDMLVGTQTISLTGAASEVINYTITTSYLGDLCPALVEVTPVCACTNPVVYDYDCNVALPVQLQSFDVRLVDGGVSLSWITTSETNTDHFEVQRSGDARSWSNIGTMKSKGEAGKAANYSLTDNSAPTGINYYRLRLIDKDGTFAYSPIRSAVVASVSARLYPNPVTNVLIVNPAGTREVSKVELLDVSGKAVHSSGAVSRIDVARLSAGIYILRISYADGGSDVERVIKK